MIDVEVGEEHRVEAVQVDTQLAEAQEGARPDVDERARDALDEHDITRGGAAVADGAARAEHDELERRRRGRRRRASDRSACRRGRLRRFAMRATDTGERSGESGESGEETSAAHAGAYHAVSGGATVRGSQAFPSWPGSRTLDP